MKLDLVFLRSFDTNPKTKTLMSYIIKGANELGWEPLCEGVETAEHYKFLKDIGCERAQGYYFGKPMPIEELFTHAERKGLEFEKNK